MKTSSWSQLFALALLSACTAAKPAGTGRGTATVGLLKPMAASQYKVRIPARWAGLYRLDTLFDQERGTALPGAIQYSYLPESPATHTEVLAVVAMYDSSAWARVKADSGPPPGDSVAARGGRVYIVALPQSNPFATGTDSTAFAAMELTAAEAAQFVVPD